MRLTPSQAPTSTLTQSFAPSQFFHFMGIIVIGGNGFKIKVMRSIVIFVAWFASVRNEPLLPSIASKMNKVVFVYPSGVQSERDLHVCPENSACNVIHNRFWLPPLVERLCKCPQRRDCNWTWTDQPDDRTMILDNRSQIKFCQDLSELPDCTVKKPALRITRRAPEKDADETPPTKNQKISQKPRRETDPKNVTALCNCQEPHYWKLKPNSTKFEENADRTQDTYFCSKLKKCSRSEFCGYVRTDTYSIFYRCSCPKGHLCISRDKLTFWVEELLYAGYGYKAFCHRV